ncbi:phage head closure protein [Devosia sp.]|uniref:phage head closure protein n=1 Tax=Devosia sp. TaxID=1871048 RepID=UPI001AD43D0F|nr:phage head closure protein [Devosia sp.]MBN9335381.1 phage head closure protein [Devosia sp.]
MRAGSLDRTIEIQTFSTTGTTPAGTPIEAWSKFATLRAAIVQSTAAEYLRGYGEGASTVMIFRTWWKSGVTADHRVRFDGRNFNIREIKELGRQQGMELRCEEVRT